MLLTRLPNVSSAGGLQALEHWLYEAETDRWSELEHTKVEDRFGWSMSPEWINNDTVVLRSNGVLAFCEPGDPGSLRYAKGG